jgi:dolichol-phosphate mannosyltransferase
MSRLATLATRLCLGAAVSDPMSGFFVFRRTWFEAARPHLSGIGFKILLDIMASGPRSPVAREIPTSLGVRIGGASKLDLRVVIELGALLIEKRARGLIPAEFVLFGCVGMTGVAVNLAALWTLQGQWHAPFWFGQGLAILVAMTWNFTLNNILTFRERRLRGAAFVKGFAAFCVSCAGGAALSEFVSASAHGLGIGWVLASASGTFCASLWNYWSVRRSAWAAQPSEALPIPGRHGISTILMKGLAMRRPVAG